MTSITAFESAIAAAFAARLPTATAIRATPSAASADSGDAVVVTAVGENSADLAAQIFDAAVLVDGLTDAPLEERLRSSLEAAAAPLGTVVLGEATRRDAAAVFVHPNTRLFDLHDAEDRLIGRLAVHVTRTAAGLAGADAGSAPRLHRIAGVEMDLTVELGRTRMAVRDVLGLEPGRIVELDRSAGAPADIRLNGRLIAHGEIVVVDQDYAVRITRILENAEA